MSPIHPAVVHFPVGLALGSVLAESAAALFGASSLASAGAWMMAGAALGAALAVPAGYYDMERNALSAPTHRLVHLHLKLGWAIALALWGLAAWRWLAMPASAVASGGYLVAAWGVAVLIAFQGWFGGEMVYSHGAGVAPAGQGQEPAGAAATRLLRVYRLIMRRPANQDSSH